MPSGLIKAFAVIQGEGTRCGGGHSLIHLRLHSETFRVPPILCQAQKRRSAYVLFTPILVQKPLRLFLLCFFISPFCRRVAEGPECGGFAKYHSSRMGRGCSGTPVQRRVCVSLPSTCTTCRVPTGGHQQTGNCVLMGGFPY